MYLVCIPTCVGIELQTAPCGCCEQNLGSQEGQPVLLTIELSLQAPKRVNIKDKIIVNFDNLSVLFVYL